MRVAPRPQMAQGIHHSPIHTHAVTGQRESLDVADLMGGDIVSTECMVPRVPYRTVWFAYLMVPRLPCVERAARARDRDTYVCFTYINR